MTSLSTDAESSGLVLAPTLLLSGSMPPPVRGLALGETRVVSDAALAWRDGRITYAGPREGLPLQEGHNASRPAVRASGAVIPGFVDCHTHLPFFGWRAGEFEARLSGRTYRDLHAEGGIYRSARLLSEATDDEVLAFCRPLLEEMLAHGTTAVELKTGYGLSVEGELRQARLARRLAAGIPQNAAVTLLACHAVPAGRAKDQWMREVCDELIPAAAKENLVDTVDVYVEDIAFGLEDLRLVADSAQDAGLALRCHADQLGPSGAAEAAAEAGARSADHLNHVSDAGIKALGTSDTVAVLLPASTLFIRGQAPPVKDLLRAGAAVALATDFNPGTSPCLSIPEAIALAASLYGLSPVASVTAASVNAAHVLGLGGELGSLEPGKRADFLVLESEDLAMIPYRLGHNPVVETWVGGERMFSRE